ncbi:hypothetical protein D9V32_15665 [Mycetocola tolaasinivorans]|uniref:Uncharacterized protein n=1 Tax=Mycetocola tolaasinivorans TaxID=76635 RepID=A0A3L6ZWR6_9MICO|nr:hypothetical protein [Mycetocola tolaasinivorans]RLP72228.1 hypothetical protein D9V32_15665 [Mycetocola tolaasinivorans]
MSPRREARSESFRERKRAVVDVILLVGSALGIVVGVTLMVGTPWHNLEQTDRLHRPGGSLQQPEIPVCP